ncbi:LysM peptidoglycan-binding domain-containing protein [Pseudofulvimonas gallinarii]|uniref:LysM domain-containing protein n=1 Tax=Pseudofulvimonas gallinarii TaxID=634155 RepID=A0A4R3L5S4_9GAMM|nr:LysM domain-containing protein [Pseudofulvimonas gallinarii]TCS95161.1 LysM domain-containing protein [Pseudofulvimonas gallinarii]THD13042.1 hypothetical protein B1808_09815 [Pseudofulvimonas gallinarii]
MFKRLLAPAVALMTFVAVHAADSVLRSDHPDRYVVQKGDTLWDISARFLRHPWLWPEIWQANPQVANPHLIYPGDVLDLSYLGGKPRLSNGGPQIRSDDEAAIPALPLSHIEAFLKSVRVLEGDAWKHLPYIVATEENRPFAAETNYVYARNLDARAGDRVAIVRPTMAYREVSKRNRQRHTVEQYARGTPWRAADSIHAPAETRRRETLLGYEVMEVGLAQVIRTGDPATLLVDDSDMEIKAGDLIVPVEVAPYDLYFYPQPPVSVPAGMEVMAVTGDGIAAGKYYVVALNRGAHDGVANGQVYSVFKPGEHIRDDVRYPNRNVFRDHRRDDSHVTLPDDFAGHVMVFRVFDRISYALVMEGQRPIHPRDRLREPYTL